MEIITIKNETWQKLNKRKINSKDTIDDVINRLLIDDDNEKHLTNINDAYLETKGVVFPEGSKFRSKVKRDKEHFAEIKEGRIYCKGKYFNSLSPAGAHSKNTDTCNGWLFWECKRPEDSKWILCDDLRTK